MRPWPHGVKAMAAAPTPPCPRSRTAAGTVDALTSARSSPSLILKLMKLLPNGSMLLCEGLATASTLHQATGRAVAVAFNCGNLLAVARALRGKFPALRMIVCADNDFATQDDPGVTHAQAAARAVGGFLAVPRFTEVVH